MPRDASGNYTLPAGNPVVGGTTITAEWANLTMPDLGNEMTDSLSRSGQGGMLVPLRVGDGTSLEPAYSFTNEISMGMYRIDTAQLGFALGGALVASMSVDMSGEKDIWTNAKLFGYQGDGNHSFFGGNIDTDIMFNSLVRIVDGGGGTVPDDYATNNNGFLLGMWQSNETATQLLYGRSGANIYKVWMRHFAVGGWNDWKLVIDGGAFTQRLDGYGDDGIYIAFDGDLNTLTGNSVFEINAAGNVTNAPDDMVNRGVLVTNQTLFDNQNQIIYGTNGESRWKIWMRSFQSSAWGDWKLVVDGGAMSLRLAGYDDDGTLVEFVGDVNDLITSNSTFGINGPDVTNEPPDLINRGIIVSLVLANFQAVQLVYGVDGASQNKIWMRDNFGGINPWKLVVDGGAMTLRYAGYQDSGFHTEYTSDLDLITFNSTYLIRGINVTNEPADFQGVSWGFITTTSRGSTSGITQTLIGTATQGDEIGNVYKTWTRYRTSASPDAWSAWKLVVNGGSFTSRLTGYADDGTHSTFTGDLDTLTINTTQRIFGTDVTNEPADFDLAGFITVQVNDNKSNMVQTIVRAEFGTNKIWQRVFSSASWDTWKLVVDGDASIAKAWVKFTGATGAILGSKGITGVVRDGLGIWTITFDKTLTSSNNGVAMASTDSVGLIVSVNVAGVNSSVVRCKAADGSTDVDGNVMHCLIFGDGV